jgi:sec-independent protein translocase protein TatA
MFGSFGWMELMLILIIVLIIFGAGKLPQLGEGLGKAIDVTPGEQPPVAPPQVQAQVMGQPEAVPPPQAAPVAQPGQTKQG